MEKMNVSVNFSKQELASLQNRKYVIEKGERKVRAITYPACKVKAEREDAFLSISGFWIAIKFAENILCKTLLLLRMIDRMILTHLVPEEESKCLSNYFFNEFFLLTS